MKIKTACNRDCPDACGILATVQDGKVVRLQGDPEHPVTQGFLCHRTSRYLKRQYSDDRITKALIRTDKKSSEFQSIKISDALDEVAARLLRYRDEFGPTSILNYRCGGSMGMMKFVTDYFFQKFGPVTTKSGDVCAGAGDWAQEQDFGIQDSNDFFDLLNAKNIIIWGKNVFVSHLHLLPVLKQAKEQGSRMILIDPVKHRTATLCDQYIPIQPGGDGALAFGMAKWLFDNDRMDLQVGNYCDNLDGYQSLINSKSIATWSEIAGVESATVQQLAKLYADGPSTILVGWGMQRRPNGANTIRAIDALAAVSGNIGKPGACVSFYFPRKGGFDLSFATSIERARTIPEPVLGRGIEEATDPPIKMIFCTAANPVTNLPESRTVKRAFENRFSVVVDMFLTDTAKCANVILPASSMLEDNDLIGAYGHHFLNRVTPIVASPDDAMTDYQIVKQIAARVGLESEFSCDAEDWLKLMCGSSADGISMFEKLGKENVLNPNAKKILFADRQFATPTGRVNLVTEFTPSSDLRTPDFPLRLMACSTDRAQASQWLPDQQRGPAVIQIHPFDAGTLATGDLAFLKTDSGQLKVEVQICEDQISGVVRLDKGGWLSAGRCANELIAANMSDHGECAAYYDTPACVIPLNG